jgi:hypothetical protein
MNVACRRPHVPSRLGVGPVSKNVLDATIRLAYRHRRTVMVITSRAQVDSAELGGGYVEGWSTELLVQYVRRRDPAGLVMICRDHGGPWQHLKETSSALDEFGAMASSLASLRCDIRSGVELLHLDTSREGDGLATFDAAVSRLVTLYGECHEFAGALGCHVAFEVGLERQCGDVDDPVEFSCKLGCMVGTLRKASLPLPTFVVGQTGTVVVGMENHGVVLEDPRFVGREVQRLAESCWRYGVSLKAHNVDYLPMAAVQELMRSGTAAVNIAPECGVIETKAFLVLLEQLELLQARDEFLRLAYNSGAWRKWFGAEDATDWERSLVAGHYVFARDEFCEIKYQADEACQKQGARTVDEVLGAALDRRLERYAKTIWADERMPSLWT